MRGTYNTSKRQRYHNVVSINNEELIVKIFQGYDMYEQFDPSIQVTEIKIVKERTKKIS